MKASSWGWLPRTTSTVTMAPVLVLLGVVVSVSNAGFSEPYWLDLSSKSTAASLFLAPGFAALAAWDAARWRDLSVAPARSWLSLLLWHGGFVMAAATVTFLTALLLVWSQNPPSVGLPRFDVLALAVWVNAAYAVFGFVLGRYLSRLKAVPIAFVAVWLWMAYTPAIEPFWIRNVTGNIGTSCCAMDTQLADGSLGAPLLLTAALAASCAAVLLRPSAKSVLAAVTGLALATGLAGWWVGDLGADPVERRTGTQECRTGKTITLCAWPEHRDSLDEALPVLEAVAERLRTAGLRVPRRLTENIPQDGWSFNLGSNEPDHWADGFATSPVNALPPTCAGEPGWGWAHGDLHALVGAWLQVSAGRHDPERPGDGTVPQDVLASLLQQSSEQQVRWFEQSLTVMATCERVG